MPAPSILSAGSGAGGGGARRWGPTGLRMVAAKALASISRATIFAFVCGFAVSLFVYGDLSRFSSAWQREKVLSRVAVTGKPGADGGMGCMQRPDGTLGAAVQPESIDALFTPERGPFPRGALLIEAAQGMHIAEGLVRQLLSVQRFMPDTFVALLLDDAVSAYVQARLHNSPLRIRAYSWPRMRARLPPEMQSMLVNEQRMKANAMVIADYRAGGTLYGDEVMWQLGMEDRARCPGIALVGLVDARDVMFQGDAWEPLWREVAADHRAAAAAAAAGKAASEGDGEASSRVRLGADGLPGILVVSQESLTMSIGRCPYNSYWIDACYGQEAKAAMSPLTILCSGVIFGTTAAVESFMTQFMVPACVNCMLMHGWEQGPHNFLLHYAAGDAEVRARYAPLKDVPSAAPTLALAEQLSQQMRVIVEPAEGDWVCTVGYIDALHDPAAAGSHGDGFIRAVGDRSRRCRVLHQFDRFPWIARRFEELFPLPQPPVFDPAPPRDPRRGAAA